LKLIAENRSYLWFDMCIKFKVNYTPGSPKILTDGVSNSKMRRYE